LTPDHSALAWLGIDDSGELDLSSWPPFAALIKVS